MTDRELLELAAKAAGIELGEWCKELDAFWRGKTGDGIWNPLADDRDAFRLAVKLGIDVFPWQNKTHDERTIGIEAATRRAIVCAAAEIGRAMP
jgi:hypothetical protein